MSKETFKSFARLHPELGEYVLKNNLSWQKLYELFEIYGENSSIWNKYFEKGQSSLTDTIGSVKTPLNDLFTSIKNMDLNSVQKGVNNIQKTIGMLENIGLSKTPPKTYTERPMYKYFED